MLRLCSGRFDLAEGFTSGRRGRRRRRRAVRHLPYLDSSEDGDYAVDGVRAARRVYHLDVDGLRDV